MRWSDQACATCGDSFIGAQQAYRDERGLHHMECKSDAKLAESLTRWSHSLGPEAQMYHDQWYGKRAQASEMPKNTGLYSAESAI